MRIIAGRLRGRKITMHPKKDLRPTTGKTREALFSILTSGKFLEEGEPFFAGKPVIDVFCGTGILGFEALSRGASNIVFIDQDNDKLQMIKNTAVQFKEESHCTFLRRSVENLPVARFPSALAFIDPPYGKELVTPTLKGLVQQDWLSDGAYIVVECGKHDAFELPTECEVVDERKYGVTRIKILQFHAS